MPIHVVPVTEPARRAAILKQLESERKIKRVSRLLGQLVPEITAQEAVAIRQKRKEGKLP